MNQVGANRVFDPRGIVVISLAVIGFAGGVARQLVPQEHSFPQADLLFALLTVGLVFSWYRMDSRRYRYRRSPILDVMVVAIAILALPYYFFRTRGLWGGLRATGLLVLAVMGYSLLQFCGAYAAYYARAF
jgi:TRAP-type uncharacterized transport system fused permease subunit